MLAPRLPGSAFGRCDLCRHPLSRLGVRYATTAVRTSARAVYFLLQKERVFEMEQGPGRGLIAIALRGPGGGGQIAALVGVAPYARDSGRKQASQRGRSCRRRKRSCFSVSMMASSTTPTPTMMTPSQKGTATVVKIPCRGGR